MNTLVLLIIMVTMFTSYVGFIWIKYGIQPSISASYYVMPRSLQWLFIIATWGYAIPAVMLGVPLSALAFLAGGAICFVGASPAFKDGGMESTVHMTGAILGIIASQLLITIVLGQWWNTLAFILLSLIIYTHPKTSPNKTWWVEIFAFISMVIGYIIHFYN